MGSHEGCAAAAVHLDPGRNLHPGSDPVAAPTAAALASEPMDCKQAAL